MVSRMREPCGGGTAVPLRWATAGNGGRPPDPRVARTALHDGALGLERDRLGRGRGLAAHSGREQCAETFAAIEGEAWQSR